MSTDHHPTGRDIPTGIGLGLRARVLKQIEAGQAEGKIAFVELSPENYMHRGGALPQRLETVARRHPVISHGLMMSLGSTDPLPDEYFGTLKAFLDRYDPPWHSDHVCFSGLDGALLHDLLPVPFCTATAKRIAARIIEARDRLERPMAVENISWYLALGHSEKDEADFITEILERADCGMLLDVNNIFVNGENHGSDPYEFLARIPLDRVWQMHVAGHERFDHGLIIDTHGDTVKDEVYELMAWVIERVGPKPVLLERDTNIPPLPELLDEVARLQKRYDQAIAVYGDSATETAHVG